MCLCKNSPTCVQMSVTHKSKKIASRTVFGFLQSKSNTVLLVQLQLGVQNSEQRQRIQNIGGIIFQLLSVKFVINRHTAIKSDEP